MAAPNSFTEPLILPVLFTIFGALTFVAGKVGETRDMKPKPWKWAGFALIGIGLFSGGGTANCMRDKFYSSAMEQFGKKMLIGHWGALLIPLFTMIGLAVWQFRSARDPYANS